jgi:hypothetical protein
LYWFEFQKRLFWVFMRLANNDLRMAISKKNTKREGLCWKNRLSFEKEHRMKRKRRPEFFANTSECIQ